MVVMTINIREEQKAMLNRLKATRKIESSSEFFRKLIDIYAFETVRVYERFGALLDLNKTHDNVDSGTFTCYYCGKKFGYKPVNHTNIHNKDLIFCSHDCKLQWIFRVDKTEVDYDKIL